MKKIFVDGYNVINSWPNLKDIREYSLESARAKLEEVLQNYSAYNNIEVIIVYDAYSVSQNYGKKEKKAKLTVVFTKEGEIADQFIERSIDVLGKRANVSVVTSDALEQQIAFQRGATRISSIEFYHDVMETQISIEKDLKKTKQGNSNSIKDVVDEHIYEKLEKMRRS